MTKFSIKKIILLIIISGLDLYSQSSQADPPELKEAKKAYSQKSYSTALKQFQSYADKFPNDGTPYVYMGYIYESKKDFSKFQKVFELAHGTVAVHALTFRSLLVRWISHPCCWKAKPDIVSRDKFRPRYRL